MPQNIPEFSRILDVKAVGNAVKEHKLGAKPEERKALARRLGIIDLEMFEVIYTVEQIPNNSYKVVGELKAHLTQACVASNVPVKEKVTDDFSVVLRPENPNSNHEDEIDLSTISTEVEEEIEIPPNGKIDMGEVFTQYLALALNPYPRKKGAEFKHKEFEEEAKPNPFDALKDLK